MNKFLVKNILISALVALCSARPRDKRDVRLADVEDSVNDFKELFTNFGSDSSEARASFDVHSSGDNFISICWNERTVIQLYKSGDLNGYVDYSISLQLAPPEDALASSDDTGTDMYEVNDIYTHNKRVLHFVTVKKTDDVTIKENRTSNCRQGQMYSRTFIQLASKKRVEIKLRSQLYKQDFQPLGLTSIRIASSGSEGSKFVLNERKMVSSEELGDQEASAAETKISESNEDSSLSAENGEQQSDSATSRMLNSKETATILKADPKHLTVMVEQSPKSSEVLNDGDGMTIIPDSVGQDVAAVRMASSDESGVAKTEDVGGIQKVITATKRMGGDSSESKVEDNGVTASARKESLDSQTGGSGEISSVSREGGVTVTGDNVQSLGSQTGGSGESTIIGKEVVITDNLRSLDPQSQGSVETTIIRKEGVIPIPGNNLRSLDSQTAESGDTASMRKTGGAPIITGDNLRSLDSQTGGSAESTVMRKEGVARLTTDNLRSLDPQTGESLETTIVRKGGVVPVTTDYILSLGPQTGSSVETTIIKKERVTPVTGDNLRSLDSQTGPSEEIESMKTVGRVLSTGDNLRSLDLQTGGSGVRRGGGVPFTGTNMRTLNSGESEVDRKEGEVPVTDDYLRSLEITTGGITDGAGMRIEGAVPTIGSYQASSEPQTEGSGETASVTRGGAVPVTGNYLRSLETHSEANGEATPMAGSYSLEVNNKASGEATSMRKEGGTPINPVMTCDDNNKLKVKVRFDIVDPAGGAKNVEKQVELDLTKYQEGNKGDNFEDALHSLVRSYYGETLNKYIDECVAAKKKAAPHGVMNRVLQDDFYVDPPNIYMNPYANLQNPYEYQYPSGGKMNRFNAPPPPHSGSFFLGSDGRYYVVHGPPEPVESESFLTKLTRTLKSALAHI